jgi:crotonobetainyl-CoA:carnitine CoA-transferase CaiB-like acyl-CoA transferase
LGFDDLRRVNPQLVMVSLTPFGQRGPYATYAGTDLVIAALSGLLALTGDPDRPPVRVGPVYQSLFHAAAEAAAGALIGHFERLRTGRAVHVDVPAILASTWATMTALLTVVLEGRVPKRAGTMRRRGNTVMPALFPCQDGYVVLDILGGTVGAASNRALWRWMAEEGMASPDLVNKDWEAWDFAQLARDPAGQAEVDRICGEAARFLLRHTKAELFDRAVRDGILLAPANQIRDLLHNRQLLARRFFWIEPDPQLGDLPHAGPLARFSATPLEFRHGAPSVPTGDGVGWPDVPSRAVAVPPVGAGPRPFSGLKVADFSWVAAGPSITQYLSTFGATVVRVESRRRPDPLRSMPPFPGHQPGLDRGGFWARVNTGKQSCVINLDTPGGQALARRLVSWADVVVESFTPGTMARWGLDYATLAADRPDLIMLSSCQMGQTGPYARYGGFGSLAAAMSGVNEATGYPDRGPGAAYGAYTDTIVPRFAIAALLAALDHRRRTGEGQYIDVSQFETAVHFTGGALLEFAVNGQDFVRRGNRARAAVPHGVFPTAGEDQWIAIVCRNDAEWQALADVLGKPAWACDPALATLAGRLAHQDALEAALAEATRTWDKYALMRALQARGVPAGAVQHADEVLVDPQIAALGYLHWLDHPEMGRIPYEGSRFLINGETPKLARSPLLGEHTVSVLQELLGLSDAELAEAVATGAVDL